MDNIYIEKDVSEIYPGLWLGNYKSATSYEFIKKHDIKCIVNVTKDIPNNFDDIDYLHIPINDKDICSKSIDRILKLYDISTEFINSCLQKKYNILVHCKRGHHRSACIIVAYLIRYQNADLIDAINYIKSIRNYALVRYTCMMKGLVEYYDIYSNNY